MVQRFQHGTIASEVGVEFGCSLTSATARLELTEELA